MAGLRDAKAIETLEGMAEDWYNQDTMIVAKKADFDAAHFLPNYQGKCSQMHGHHWVVEVAVEAQVNGRTGMVIDFTILSTFLKGICETFDHTLINDVISNPTAENIIRYIKDNFVLQGMEGKTLKWIKCWETPDSMAMWEN